MREHTLKTDPEVYDAMERGDKTHEIRFNDRDYQAGDLLVLQRTTHSGQAMRDGKPLSYTPCKTMRRVVTHVLEGYGLQPGWCILSVREEHPHRQLVAQLERERDGWQEEAERRRLEMIDWRRQLKLLRDHQDHNVWSWQGDGEDHPESMANDLTVVIRADDLRGLLEAR